MESNSGDLTLGLLSQSINRNRPKKNLTWTYEEIFENEINKLNPVLKGHSGSIVSLALTSDNNLLFSCSTDNSFRVWSLITFKELEMFQIPVSFGHCILKMVISDDCQNVIFSDSENHIIIWSWALKKVVSIVKVALSELKTLAVSCDSLFMAAPFDERTVKVWEIRTGKEVKKHEIHTSTPYFVCFTNKLLISCDCEGTVIAWNTEKEKKEFSLHQEGLMAYMLAGHISHDFKYLALAYGCSKLIIWDLDRQELYMNLDHNYSITGLSFAKEGPNLVCSTSESNLLLVSLKERKIVESFSRHSGPISDVIQTNDAKYIISAGFDKLIKVWQKGEFQNCTVSSKYGHSVVTSDLDKDNENFVIGFSDSSIRVLALSQDKEILNFQWTGKILHKAIFSNDHKFVISSNGKPEIAVFSVESKQNEFTLDGIAGGSVVSLALSADSKWLYGGDSLEFIYVWDFQSQVLDHKLQSSVYGNHCLVLSTDGQKLFSAGDSCVKIWDLMDRTVSSMLECSSAVKTLVLLADNKLLVTGEEDGKIRFWDLNENCLRSFIDAENGAVADMTLFNEEKYLVIAYGASKVTIVNMDSLEIEYEIEIPTCVYCVKVLDDNNTLIVSDYQNIGFWNLEKKAEEFVFKAHYLKISALLVDETLGVLISASEDRTIKEWNLTDRSLSNTYQSYCGTISCIALNGDNIVIGSEESNLTVMSLSCAKELKLFCYHNGTVSSVDTKSEFFASGGTDNKVFIFDSNEYKPYCLEGHNGWVNCVKFSVDANFLYSGADDSSICIWNTMKKTLDHKLDGHSGSVYCLCPFPDGRNLASGSSDNQIKIWDLRKKKDTISLLYHKNKVLSLAISEDQKTLYSGSEDLTIVASDIKEKKPMRTFTGFNSSIVKLNLYKDLLYSTERNGKVKTWPITEKKEERCFSFNGGYCSILAVSPDGKFLAAGFNDGDLCIYNLNKGKFLDTTMPVGNKALDRIQFTKDSKKLIIGAYDASIVIWDIKLKKGEEIRKSKAHSASLSFSPDYNYILSCSSDNKILFWNFETRKLEFSLEGHTSKITEFIFTPCGTTLFSTSEDSKIKKWDTKNRELLAEYSEHYGAVNSIALAYTKNILVSGGNDYYVIFWDTAKDAKICVGNEHNGWVRTVKINSDESFAITGGDDKLIILWDLNLVSSEGIQAKHLLRSHSDAVLSLVLSIDEKKLYSSSADQTIISWDLESKSIKNYIRSTCGFVYCIVVNSDGTKAYTGSDLNTVNCFDLLNNSEVFCLSAHSKTITSLALSKDEKILISGSLDERLKVFDLTTCTEIATLGEGVHYDSIRSVAITDDNKYIASCSDDKLIIIWNLKEKSKEFSLEGHQSFVLSVKFLQNYKYVLSASRDETVKLWEFSSKNIIYTFKGHTASVRCLAVFNNSTGFASGSFDNSIIVWVFKDRRANYSLKGHTGAVNALSLTSDDRWLASGSEDGTIKIWNLEQRSIDIEIKSIGTAVNSVALTPDSCFLLSSASCRGLKMWEIGNFGFEYEHYVNKHYLSVLTPDDKFELVYLNGRLHNVIDKENILARPAKVGISDLLDPSYQNLNLYYNTVDAVRSDCYKNIHPESSSIRISRFAYSLLHILCLKGNHKSIKDVLTENTVLRSDFFGYSPLYYAIKKQNQKCFDLILDFLISLIKAEDWLRVSASFVALSNEIPMIIKSSSSKLRALFSGFLVPGNKTYVRANRELPHCIFNDKFMPMMSDFIAQTSENIPFSSVIISQTHFKLPYLLGSENCVEMLECIFGCANLEIFDVKIIQYWIQLQWNSIIWWIFYYSLLLWTNLILLVYLFTVNLLISTWTFPCFLVVNFKLILWEIIQMHNCGFLEYIKDPWNRIDLSRMLFTASWIFLNIFEMNDGLAYRVIIWLVALLNFTAGLRGFRIFDGTRYYLRLIIRALNDIGYFLVLFSYSTIAFGVMFQVSRNSDPFEFKTLWMDSYTLNFGNFEPRENYNLSFETVAYLFATIANVILMLNLLISILGESFSNFQNEKNYIDFCEKAGVVLEIQKMFFWVGKKTENRYFQVLSTSDMDCEEGVEIDEHFKALDKKVDSMNKKLTEKIENVQTELGDSIHLLSDKVENFENKLNSLTENVLKIIEIVSSKDFKSQ